jgi:hypothetical protein
MECGPKLNRTGRNVCLATFVFNLIILAIVGIMTSQMINRSKEDKLEGMTPPATGTDGAPIAKPDADKGDI